MKLFKELTNENSEPVLFDFFDKTRNAVIHNMIDIIGEEDGQTLYAFQDFNNNTETNYVLTNISSDNLKSILNIGIKYLELYEQAMLEIVERENGQCL